MTVGESGGSLLDALAQVRAALERHLARLAGETGPERRPIEFDSRSTVGVLVDRFGLTSFERDLIVLCAGMELDGGFAALCDRAQGGVGRPFPTFSLALAALDDAHWSALTPEAPLRRFRLLEVGTGPALVYSPLRIAESVANFLVGIPHLDERLGGFARLRPASPDRLVPSQLAIVERISAAFETGALCLAGDDHTALLDIATCPTDNETATLVVNVSALPAGPAELEALLRLVERESLLHRARIVLDAFEVGSDDAARLTVLRRALDTIRQALVLVRDRLPLDRPVIEAHPPTREEQVALWRELIGDLPIVLALTDQFNLSASAIRAAVASAQGDGRRAKGRGEREGETLTPALSLPRERVLGGDESPSNGDPAVAAGSRSGDRSYPPVDPPVQGDQPAQGDQPVAPTGVVPPFAFRLPPSDLWDACRELARPGLDDLAQRVEAAATWDRLVLPVAQKAILAEIAVHVRGRSRVYEEWGFGGFGSRGLGISALFAGASGTGKTMAAEVIARELRLDLYRIDLSAVVSKYIGETEKNLRRVFDAAETGGVVLLFDEADALFGKRSEVKDSHDRYANIEVGYLLQRMESYRGLAILTTNLKSALDPAFLRRIRFVVQFPFPDAPARAQIWRQIFPTRTPLFGLDYDKLARLNVAGGNIRNIALGAAFLAAADGGRVEMPHLLAAARSEYSKIERVLTETEIAGWHD